MSAAPQPLTAEEIERLRKPAEKLAAIIKRDPFDPAARARAADELIAAFGMLTASEVLRLCDAAESAAAKDAEIASLRWSVGYWTDSTESASKALAALHQRAERAEADAAKYRQLHTPEVADFIKALERESLFQRDKWAAHGDAGKSDADWFWLVGYLAGKAIRPDATKEKQLHHIITTAAACLNWHGARVGAYTLMRPGHEEGIDGSQPPAEGDKP